MIQPRWSIAGSFRAEYFARHYIRQSLTGPAAEPDPGSHKRPNGGTALGDGPPPTAVWLSSGPRNNCCIFLSLVRPRYATSLLFGLVRLSCSTPRSPAPCRSSDRPSDRQRTLAG